MIVVDEADLPHTDTILLTIFVTIGALGLAHGISARPLTARYAKWFATHPRMPMERVEVPGAALAASLGATRAFPQALARRTGIGSAAG